MSILYPRSYKRLCALGAIMAFLIPSPAFGEVICWEGIGTGVDWCAETLTPAGSSGEIAVHWAVIDLTEPSLYVRVTREGEGPCTTSAAAALLDSTVTINGDWSDTEWDRPLGLSVGHGWKWTGSHDWDNSINPPGDWSFLACTAKKECRFNPPKTKEEWVMWRDLNIIGGNGARISMNGVLQTPAYDNNRVPRSAVCLNQDSTEMRVYASGGECTSCNIGFTPSDFAAYIFGEGCWSGMMLDGGGSTDLVLNGTRVGDRPQGEPNERVRENHLSIVHNTNIAAECATMMNGRYCEGPVLHTCFAGMDDPVDCAFFVQTCGEGSGTAYCVDAQCKNGANNDACINDVYMARCQYGQVFQFACSDLFGATCEDSGDNSARCVMAGCDFGGDATWCDGDLLKTCAPMAGADPAMSLLTSIDCSETGEICAPSTLTCEEASTFPADISESADTTSPVDDTGDGSGDEGASGEPDVEEDSNPTPPDSNPTPPDVNPQTPPPMDTTTESTSSAVPDLGGSTGFTVGADTHEDGSGGSGSSSGCSAGSTPKMPVAVILASLGFLICLRRRKWTLTEDATV